MSKNQPELRFPGHTQEWKETRIQDIGKISTGTTPSTAIAENYSNTGYPFITPTDIASKYVVSTERKISGFGIKKGRLVPKGAILVTCIASIGKNSIAIEESSFNQQINAIVVSNEHDNEFIYYAIEKNVGKLKAASGVGTMSILNKSEFSKVSIWLPQIQEQVQIANFLSTLDSRITLQSEKVGGLQELKKGLMQKIFSQEIRFRREDGGEYPAWEDVSIKDILKIRHGRSQKLVEDENGQYPILGTGGLMAYANDYLYDKPSVLIGRKGTIDKPQYMETPFWTVDTLFYSEIFSGIHPKFVYYLFQTINWKNYNEASGVPSLSASTIGSIEISCPPEPEQQKIGEFLSTIDSKISLESEILSTLQILKKGLLQQMFV